MLYSSAHPEDRATLGSDPSAAVGGYTVRQGFFGSALSFTTPESPKALNPNEPPKRPESPNVSDSRTGGCPPLELGRAEISQSGMAPPSVVPALDKVKDIGPGL